MTDLGRPARKHDDPAPPAQEVFRVASDVGEPPHRETFLRRHTEEHDPSVRFFTAGRFVVIAYDPQTGEVDSYGPYDGPAAATECRRRRAAFDDGDLEDVIVVVAPLWRP